MTEKLVTLIHYERGPMLVAVWDEATWWMRRRQWTCPVDPELGTFEDEDFDETKEQIDEALACVTIIASEPSTSGVRP